MNARLRLISRRMVPMLALAASIATGAAQAATPRPLDAEELAVSAGSWLCERYLPAAGARGPAAQGIVDAVEPFVLDYVAGVADATGRPLPETPETRQRILSLLGEGCRADSGRAIRDVTLLAGRAMIESVAAAAGPPTGPAHPGPGHAGCGDWLAARSRASAPREDNWAEGYVNARFERAGRGLIPTARNRLRVLSQVADACAATPSAMLREGARRAADQALAALGSPR